MFERYVAKDTVLGGVEMKAGSIIWLCVASANRNRTQWDDPDTFDITRPIKRHFAFGAGVHACLGQHLSRREMEVALGAAGARSPARPALEPGRGALAHVGRHPRRSRTGRAQGALHARSLTGVTSTRTASQGEQPCPSRNLKEAPKPLRSCVSPTRTPTSIRHLFWKDYLPEKFRGMAPEIEEGDEHDWVVFEGRRPRPLFILSNQAGREAKNYKVMGKLSDLHMSSTPDQHLKDMSLDGIETAILYGGGPLGTMDTDLYVESFRAYNRWLADFCKARPDRLVGVAYLPMRDVDKPCNCCARR